MPKICQAFSKRKKKNRDANAVITNPMLVLVSKKTDILPCQKKPPPLPSPKKPAISIYTRPFLFQFLAMILVGMY